MEITLRRFRFVKNFIFMFKCHLEQFSWPYHIVPLGLFSDGVISSHAVFESLLILPVEVVISFREI